MALLTIQEDINNGLICTYLAANKKASGALFPNVLPTTDAVTIAIVTQALKWQYEAAPTTTNLRLVANYLYWLTAAFNLQSKYIMQGSGGGTVIPVNPNTPSPLQFVVDASTSFMIDGQTTATIPQFIGYNVLFARNGIPQSNLISQPSYYTWDKNTAIFTVLPQAYTGDLFQIYAI